MIGDCHTLDLSDEELNLVRHALDYLMQQLIATAVLDLVDVWPDQRPRRGRPNCYLVRRVKILRTNASRTRAGIRSQVANIEKEG